MVVVVWGGFLDVHLYMCDVQQDMHFVQQMYHTYAIQ